MLCGLRKIFPHAGAKKEDKKAYGLQIWHFYWSFSNDIQAVKGLKVSVCKFHGWGRGLDKTTVKGNDNILESFKKVARGRHVFASTSRNLIKTFCPISQTR